MKNFIFILSLISSPLFANDYSFDKASGKNLPNFVGEIKIFRGTVYKLSQGKKEKVLAGTRFFKSDSIITEDKSFAKIQVVDDSIVAIGPNSELNFEEFKFMEKNNRHIIYNFVKGQLSGHVKNKAKEGDLVMKTKTAVMGIRGTKILINHQTINNVDISEFALLTGEATVTDAQNKKHTLNKADRYAFLKDSLSQEVAQDKMQLSTDELKQLEAEHLDENKDFKPFMPYLDPGAVHKNSSLYAYLHKAHANSEQEKATKALEKEESTPSASDQPLWKRNLEKLNKELKKNHSR